MMAAHLADRVKSIRAVLFDKDGTLIDFDRTWFSISWQLAQWSAQGDEMLARALLDAGVMTGWPNVFAPIPSSPPERWKILFRFGIRASRGRNCVH
ncbi:hydrolase, haloacid dehalogenase-like family [Brucella abortus]|nr:hydrolase, haloacid dehalogenase-like family [Brucella abortus]